MAKVVLTCIFEMFVGKQCFLHHKGKFMLLVMTFSQKSVTSEDLFQNQIVQKNRYTEEDD